MKDMIIVQNISKRYKRGAQQEKYLSIRDKLSSLRSSRRCKESFLALEDVSFKVSEGESLAIIGKNGAGKSTLLKILSKITPPTSGQILLKGRLASLLEVGTGFHPELTGRENIFLNGSILGLSRLEIKRYYDAIIEFSGVEAFIETPLKHYSSGMQLRLAFSVAVHLEPEILVIDEVLAVGDTTFQQKCIDKMTEVSKGGRTILFVSHNMQAVRNLCSRAILLSEGRIAFNGSVNEAIEKYTGSGKDVMSEIDLTQIKRKTKCTGRARMVRLFILNNPCKSGENIEIEVTTHADQNLREDVVLGISIQDAEGSIIYHISNQWINKPILICVGKQSFRFSINNDLRPGKYMLNLYLGSDREVLDYIRDEVSLEVLEGNPYSYSNTEIIQGKVFPQFTFKQLK